MAIDDGTGQPGPSGIDASFFIQLGAQVSNIAAQQQADQDRRDRLAALIPTDNLLVQNCTPAANGVGFMDLASPPQGRFWQVRLIAVGGTHATDVAAGSAYVFRSAAVPADLPMVNLVDMAISELPNIAFYSTHQFPVQQGEHIWIVVVGATPGQQYVAGVTIESYSIAARGRPES